MFQGQISETEILPELKILKFFEFKNLDLAFCQCICYHCNTKTNSRVPSSCIIHSINFLKIFCPEQKLSLKFRWLTSNSFMQPITAIVTKNNENGTSLQMKLTWNSKVLLFKQQPSCSSAPIFYIPCS